MYTATIRRSGDGPRLKKIFAAENKAFPNDRATYETVVDDDNLIITAEAQDTKALKAVMNSITTILDIYDKSKQITS